MKKKSNYFSKTTNPARLDTQVLGRWIALSKHLCVFINLGIWATNFHLCTRLSSQKLKWAHLSSLCFLFFCFFPFRPYPLISYSTEICEASWWVHLLKPKSHFFPSVLKGLGQNLTPIWIVITFWTHTRWETYFACSRFSTSGAWLGASWMLN